MPTVTKNLRLCDKKKEGWTGKNEKYARNIKKARLKVEIEQKKTKIGLVEGYAYDFQFFE